MKPACVPCQRFLRPKRNGYYFIEGMPAGNHRPASGVSEADQWTPYKLWVGDLWQCEGCGAQIIAGVASSPLAEHYQPRFADAVKHYAPQVQINDC